MNTLEHSSQNKEVLQNYEDEIMPQKPVENGIEVAGGLDDQLQHL